MSLGSVLSPLLFKIYTNGQPLHDKMYNLIYADDLCVTAQHTSFNQVEATVKEALGELIHDYRAYSLRANPDKTQVTAFHLWNKEVKQSLNFKWNISDMGNTAYPKYLGVTPGQDTQLQGAHT